MLEPEVTNVFSLVLLLTKNDYNRPSLKETSLSEPYLYALRWLRNTGTILANGPRAALYIKVLEVKTRTSNTNM